MQHQCQIFTEDISKSTVTLWCIMLVIIWRSCMNLMYKNIALQISVNYVWKYKKVISYIAFLSKFKNKFLKLHCYKLIKLSRGPEKLPLPVFYHSTLLFLTNMNQSTEVYSSPHLMNKYLSNLFVLRGHTKWQTKNKLL